MKRWTSMPAGLLLATLALLGSASPGTQADTLRDFAHPPQHFWPRPLWFWNDTTVSPGTVRDQMQQARDRSRYGGFGILPFGKNFSPGYLTDDYFAVYGAALEQAQALGLTLSLYDEYGFPSGSAGSQNSSDTSLFAQRWPHLTIKRLDKLEWNLAGPTTFLTNLPPGRIAAVVAMETQTLQRLELSDQVRDRRLQWSAPAGAWKLMAFLCVKDGDPICDYLDPEAADRFIELTHQAYYDRFARHFGTTIDSTFHDEPTLYRAAGRTWTDRFNEKFQARHGYDPRPFYPALWYDIGPDTAAARNALFGFRTELYATGFMKRIQDWCDTHRIQATGHQDQEEVINPVSVSGDLIKCFRYQAIPGIDKIGGDRPAERFYKVVSSAAYNWDRALVMSETYGAMGDLPWDEIYAVALEQYTKGINVLIPHAVWFDDQKVTFKPELSWRHPTYGPRLPEFNTFLARLNLLLQNSDAHVADIALLYPIATLQGSHHLDGPLGHYQGGVAVPEADYVQVGELLSNQIGRDFTYLHPEALSERCRIRDGGIDLTNHIHPARFRVLILPGHKTIAWTNLARIQQFHAQGGHVIATGTLPTQSAEFGHDAEVRRTIETLFATPTAATADSGLTLRTNSAGGMAIRLTRLDANTLQRAMDSVHHAYDVTFAPGQVLRYLHKTRGDRDTYLFANLNPTLSRATVTLRGQHHLLAWDPHSGETRPVTSQTVRRSGQPFTEVTLDLPYLRAVFLRTR